MSQQFESRMLTEAGSYLELMNLPFNIGVLQLSMEPVRETVAMAKACEQAGFDTFWIAEAYPWWRKHSFEARSSTAILAVIARDAGPGWRPVSFGARRLQDFHERNW